MAGNTPFWSGKDAKMVFLMDNKKINIYPKTWDVTEDATIIADDVGGEDRSRLQKIVNFYSWNVEAFQPDLELLAAMLNYDAKLDTRTTPFECGAGIIIYPNNGTKAGFEGRELSIDAWKFTGNPGRTERGMITVPFRTRYFEPVPTP